MVDIKKRKKKVFRQIVARTHAFNKIFANKLYGIC